MTKILTVVNFHLGFATEGGKVGLSYGQKLDKFRIGWQIQYIAGKVCEISKCKSLEHLQEQVRSK